MAHVTTLESTPAAQASPGIARFAIEAAATPHTLARLINVFAQRSLTPALVTAEVSGATLWARIEVPGLAMAEADLLAERLRAAVLVSRVMLEMR